VTGFVDRVSPLLVFAALGIVMALADWSVRMARAYLEMAPQSPVRRAQFPMTRPAILFVAHMFGMIMILTAFRVVRAPGPTLSSFSFSSYQCPAGTYQSVGNCVDASAGFYVPTEGMRYVDPLSPSCHALAFRLTHLRLVQYPTVVSAGSLQHWRVCSCSLTLPPFVCFFVPNHCPCVGLSQCTGMRPLSSSMSTALYHPISRSTANCGIVVCYNLFFVGYRQVSCWFNQYTALLSRHSSSFALPLLVPCLHAANRQRMT
jgi:hypothetical protein